MVSTSSSSSHQYKTKFSFSSHLTIFFFTIFITPSFSFSSPSSKISYTQYCNSTVPQSTPNGIFLSRLSFPDLKTGYFNGGEKVLVKNTTFTENPSPKSFVFRTQKVSKTDLDGVLYVEGSLVFRIGSMFSMGSNFSYEGTKSGRFKTRRHRFPVRRNRVSFDLNGFWSEDSGKFCMLGTGVGYSKEGNLLDLSGVFKLNYPNNSTVFTSLVSGSLDSVDSADSVNYFEPISVLTFSPRNYVYSLVVNDSESGFSGGGGVAKDSVLSLGPRMSICSELYRRSRVFELEYGSNCDATKNCSPVASSIGDLLEFMSFSQLQCSDERRLRLLIGFSNTSHAVYRDALAPSTMLVGEGHWNGDHNQLHIVACRFLNYSDSLANASVGDCSIRLSVWFPAIMTITNRSIVAGQIWSNKTSNESGYFDKIVFQSPVNRIYPSPGLKYEYTKTGRVVKSCAKKTAAKKGVIYPSGYSYDMKFDMRVRNSKGAQSWGYSVPLSVGDQFYEQGGPIIEFDAVTPESSVQVIDKHLKGLLNVSYSLSLAPDYNVGGAPFSKKASLISTHADISAEGVYNPETGSLCMVGCRSVKTSNHHSIDCEIQINIQFRPLNSKSSSYVKGTVESTRGQLDPFYFEKLQLFAVSLSTIQAAESVWRVDLEISMVLISNTLICIFVGLQVFYVKKNPDVLPSISLVMLAILTLGQMIPLVLNFEALFKTNHNRQNIVMGSGGWLEVNEVLVRVVTMVAFLLQFRLLQLTWSSKLGDGDQKVLLLAEKKALFVLLPLYLIGAFVAWGLHWWINHNEAPWRYGSISVYHGHSIWVDLRSYAGLLRDGFLLPQILLNVFSNIKDKALHPAFYVGITFVHLLPHAYDLYRSHRYAPHLDASYIYANGGDFFSTAWDVIIPCGGLLFATLIYLQQRFGGCCILPSKFKQSAAYEKVPVASG